MLQMIPQLFQFIPKLAGPAGQGTEWRQRLPRQPCVADWTCRQHGACPARL